MTDWHSHILPGIDDGSKNVVESLAMLSMLAEQGVTTLIATPHYDADRHTPETFIERRTEAYNTLMAAIPSATPLKILCGAEVRYYKGIGHLKELPRLCIEGSDILLLEMPFSKWTEPMIQEIIQISAVRGITVMLAHIERYFRYTSQTTWRRLSAEGILLQTNAGFYITLSTRYKALSMLRGGIVHAIGSDCHNLTTRPPQIGRAWEIISRKYGTSFLHWLSERDRSLLI